AKAGELLGQIVGFLDEPMADPAAIPTYLMSKVAREDVTVVLTGEGADELFAGYEWYGWMQPGSSRSFARAIPGPIRNSVAGTVQRLMDGRRGKRTLMSSLLCDFEEQYFETIACSVFQRMERHRLFTEDVRRELDNKSQSYRFEHYLGNSRKYDSLSRTQYLDTKIWLEGDPLVKVDRMSMAVSLEARVPFLDHRLAEFAAQLPPDLKRKGSIAKYILREAMKGKLPNQILFRRKHAFNVPIAEWLRTDLKASIIALPEHQAIAGEGLFNKSYVEKMVSLHLSGKRNYGSELWTLLNFAVWYTTCFKKD
ncbi:MAG: asparagine synthase C-terminal domain-containing protein, partial [Thaumarchaeota archaeon]|nr:asparagine synthase C-terminal domain-containing protein [Nitrososphaerota archaeon]